MEEPIESAVKDLLVPTAGLECIKYGLVRKSRVREYNGKVLIPFWWANVFNTLQLMKSIAALILGFKNEVFVQYFVDSFALYGSKAVWAYFHILVIIGSLGTFVIRATFGDIYDQKWFQTTIFALRGHQVASLELSGRHLVSFFRIARFAFFGFNFLVCYLMVVSLCIFVPPYVYNYFCWKTLLLLPLNLIYFIGIFLQCYTACTLPILYLFIVSHFITCRCQALVVMAASFRQKQKEGQRHYLRIFREQKAKALVAHSRKTLAVLRDFNRFYKRKLPILLTTPLGGCLISLFGVQDSYDVNTQVLMFACVTCELAMLYVYFGLSAFVIRALRKVLFVFQLCLPQSLAFRYKWHLFLIVEYLRSKRNKIGIHCYHWFVFNHFAFVKVLMFASSLYFMMVRFSKTI